MFDLKTEVAAWSEALHADRCRNSAEVAEIIDHLHCEIDDARAKGLSDEQAFAAAVAKLGTRPELAAEEAKNRSLLRRGCAAVARYERSQSAGGHGGLFIAHALIWAALILATSIILAKTDAPGASASYLLTGVLVPSWWVSQQILRRALRQKPTGGGA